MDGHDDGGGGVVGLWFLDTIMRAPIMSRQYKGKKEEEGRDKEG